MSRTFTSAKPAKLIEKRKEKKSVLRSQQQHRERHAFRAAMHTLVAGAEYL